MKERMSWKKIKAASQYAGISERLFRDFLKKGLRHSRLPSGTILVKEAWLDEYFESFEVKENQIEKIVNEVVKEI